MNECINFVCNVDVVTWGSAMALGTMLFVLRYGDWSEDKKEREGWMRATFFVAGLSMLILMFRLLGVVV